MFFPLILVFVLSVAESNAFNFKVGQFNSRYAVYMRYSAPRNSRLSLNLIQQNGNIGIHVNPRYSDDSGYCRNALVLNNLVSGRWQTEIRPSGFPFLCNTRTSMVIVPERSCYRIFFDFGSQTRTYTFPFRNGHNPRLVTKVEEYRSSLCSKTARPTVSEVSLGYTIIPRLIIGTAIYVRGTAPTTGRMFVDLSLGQPQKRDDLPVPVRITATFGNKPQIFLQRVQSNGAVQTVKTVANPIGKGGSFTINIVAQQSTYLVAVNCRVIGKISSANNLCKRATVWVTGTTAVERIESF